MKSILSSKTVWLAIIQGVIGGTIIVLTELDLVGYVAIAKSLGDIVLRFVTSEEIKF